MCGLRYNLIFFLPRPGSTYADSGSHMAFDYQLNSANAMHKQPYMKQTCIAVFQKKKFPKEVADYIWLESSSWFVLL